MGDPDGDFPQGAQGIQVMEQVNDNLEWLIRDNANVIRGPFKHAEVLQLIRKGQLKGKTEISRANSYWFALEEKAELARFFPELGIKAPESPTQMTATLTQADVSDQGVEITQFTASPSRKELADGTAEKAAGQAVEWLSDEFAEDFGADLTDGSLEIGTKTEIDSKTETAPPGSASASEEEKARLDLLKRNSVKKDTLPSEHKHFGGERPKPMDTIFRDPERQAKAQPQPVIVTVPVNGPEGGRIIPGEGKEESGNKRSMGRGRKALIAAAALVVAGAGGSVYFLMTGEPGVRPAAPEKRGAGASKDIDIRSSLTLFDLDGARAALSELEQNPDSRRNLNFFLAQALIRREFLYDADGAIVSLQSARAVVSEKQAEGEIDNLLAVYGFERDSDASIEGLRAVVAAFPADPVFRYNLALALLRKKEPREALQVVSSIKAAIDSSHPLAEDAALLMGWARDLASNGNDPGAEAAYLQALSGNPLSAKARLGLATHRLRKGGMKASEADFRAFVESMPELEVPSRALNFRKMSDFDFYHFARAQLRDLNVPDGAAGVKPSPLVMAVDAMLSCMQSRNVEAGKILDGALNVAPGDIHLLKAVGYHRWKDGRFAEVIELFKDIPKDKQTFSLALLLGKANLKTGRKDLAEDYFERLTRINPSRPEGWSLLGDLVLQEGKPEAARKNLEKALEVDPLDLLALRGIHRLGKPVIGSPEIARNLPF